MSSTTRPCRLVTGLSIQDMGAEVLVYDERRHKAFCLNPVAAAVFNLCDGQHTEAEIARSATIRLALPVEEDLVRWTLAVLHEDGLLQADLSGASTAVSRRQMLQRLGAGAAVMLPVVSAVLAPTAAQAYNGCVDCTDSDSEATSKRRRQWLGYQQQQSSKKRSTPNQSGGSQ